MGFKRPMPHIHSYDVEKYKYVYIPLQQQGWRAAALASDAADVAEGALVQSAGTNNAPFGEVSTFGVTGLHIAQAGDDIVHLFVIPFDMDVASPMDFRVWWSSASSTTTDTFTWKILYDEITTDGEALAFPTSALSTAIAADTLVGANYLQASPWGTLNGGTLTHGNAVVLGVELDATDATVSSEATYGYILEIRYIRRAL